jgi:hypothetical protein
MIYDVLWPAAQGQIRSPSRFATWDGKVTDATPALTWAIGQTYFAVVERLELAYQARVRLVPNTHTRFKVR